MREHYECTTGLSSVLDQFFKKKRYSTNPLIRRIKFHNNLLSELILKTDYLETDSSVSVRLYHLIHGPALPVCKQCGGSVLFGKFKDGYNKFCCRTCSNQYNWDNVTDETIKKRTANTRDTCLLKYGESWYSKTREYDNKVKNTCIERYGVENVMQTLEVKERQQQTTIDRHGGIGLASASIMNTHKENNMKRYGVEYSWQMPGVLDKIQKSRLKFKEYTFPSGRKVMVQGYENFALDYLLTKYQETDIFVTNHNIHNKIGKIEYFNRGKTRVYFPDIYIQSENLIVEVKSRYTYDYWTEENLLKRDACLAKGFAFNFLIFNRDGTQCEDYK